MASIPAFWLEVDATPVGNTKAILQLFGMGSNGHYIPEGAMDAGLKGLKLSQLKLAVQNNAISFPSQMPVFERRPLSHVQWRMAHLFFVSGWSLVKLGTRYRLPSWRVGSLVREWIELAIAFGYVQEIPIPETAPAAGRIVVEFRRCTAQEATSPILQVRDLEAGVNSNGNDTNGTEWITPFSKMRSIE